MKALIVGLFILVVLSAGCTQNSSTTPRPSQSEPIIGTWAFYAMGGTQAIYTFNSDGTGAVTFTDNNQVEKLTWKKESSNKYTVSYQNPAILKGREGYLIYDNNWGETLKDSQGYQLARYTP